MGLGVEIRLRYLTCLDLPVKKEPIHLRIQEGKLSCQQLKKLYTLIHIVTIASLS